jgi:FO synthase
MMREEALALASETDTPRLMRQASGLRDEGFRNLVTYSRKVFIPLTQLCRDVCHYCTFAQTPTRVTSAFMSLEQVLETVQTAKEQGCKEVLFTLGERPELRYNAAANALSAMGFDSTLDYLGYVADQVLRDTGLLPHINAGCMSREEMLNLRPVSASMGLMLESASSRLCKKGMPHYGSPDKDPSRRLETLRLAGELEIPFTSGILIGIGETRRERIESLLQLRDLHQQYGHLQEIIVQNFRAKPGTRMAMAPEPDLNELLWTIAVARLIFGPQMSIQAPPNLSPGVLPQLINSGLNDWGGVSPVTPDFVNPEAPWPHLDQLQRETAFAGKFLQQRLTVYPDYVAEGQKWLDPNVRAIVMSMADTEGYARTDHWVCGDGSEVPDSELQRIETEVQADDVDDRLREIVGRAKSGSALTEADIVRLFQARGPEFSFVCQQADGLRQEVKGDAVTYVVNRNINYTNVCYFNCRFCAFSKSKGRQNSGDPAYDLPSQEIARRALEARQGGATEVCMQGGIHPRYTGQTYLDILATIKTSTPDMHVHAFSPLEVWQGAQTLNISVAQFLDQLKRAGLGSLPGTAAEILDDEVREIICPDKIDTSQWLEVIEAAHNTGLKTTATIMFGHVDKLRHWARHLIRIRDLQAKTGGFTEFVPLPFVATESPLYTRGRSRKGPTFRETVLMHAVARLVLHGQIGNIQTSWVKLGRSGVRAILKAGVNDLGGTLMNESISRAAGASHGQEMQAGEIRALAVEAGRSVQQRNTLYQPLAVNQTAVNQAAVNRPPEELAEIIHTSITQCLSF